MGRRLVIGLAVVLSQGCNKPDPDDARSASPKTSEAPEHEEPSEARTSGQAEKWRFRPTLDKAMPDKTKAEPLIEAALPNHGRVRIVAATYRADADLHLSIEVWTFDQSGPKGTLALAGEPRPVLRLLDEGPSADELKTLRRELAAPGTTIVRPIGVEAAGAGELVGTLAQAAGVVLDEEAAAEARLGAVATIVRGVDDAIVLEQDGLGRVVETLAGGPVEVQSEDEASPRRRRASVKIGEQTWTIALMKKGAGWVISDLTPAK